MSGDGLGSQQGRKYFLSNLTLDESLNLRVFRFLRLYCTTFTMHGSRLVISVAPSKGIPSQDGRSVKLAKHLEEKL